MLSFGEEDTQLLWSQIVDQLEEHILVSFQMSSSVVFQPISGLFGISMLLFVMILAA